MKVTKIIFWISSMVRKSKGTVHMVLAIGTLLFGMANPLWGQKKTSVDAYLEDDRLFLVLDKDLMEMPMLFVRHDLGQLMVHWSKVSEQVVLMQDRARSVLGEYLTIDADYRINERVLAKFKTIQDKDNTQSLTIDATELVLVNDIKWFAYDATEDIDLQKSYVHQVEKVDGEIVIRTKRTVHTGSTIKTMATDYSFFQLPEQPMRPRLFDHRMGYYLEDVWDAQRTDNYNAAIMRWRLEKEEPKDPISKPVTPITFYFHPDVPVRWKSYIRAGILEWSTPFKAAGFMNAIHVKDLPDGAPSGHSVTYSMIRWENFSRVRGSEQESGSTAKMIVDPRTGEILKADILISSSARSLVEEYIVRCAPMDVRAQQYPVSESLVGELFQYVTSHETGHALGLMDGNYGEYGYPVEKMREVEWLREMGHTPSIMTYARHNYIAQPEDGIPPSLLIQKVGPMDEFQIAWGYSVFPSSSSPWEERSELDSLILDKERIPWYLFNADRYGWIGPANTNEVVDNRDPIRSTELGLKNIKRVMELLPKLNLDQRDDALLLRLYDKTMELWFDQMRHVLSLVGGYTVHYKSGQQSGDVFVPISMDEQARALDFLLEHGFIVPDWLSNPSYKNRIDQPSTTDQLLVYQLRLLTELLGVARIGRLEKMEVDSNEKKALSNMIKEIQEGLFAELRDLNGNISNRRMALQSAYIELMVAMRDTEFPFSTVSLGKLQRSPSPIVKSVCQYNLLELQKRMELEVSEMKDGPLKAHFQQCVDRINGYAQ